MDDFETISATHALSLTKSSCYPHSTVNLHRSKLYMYQKLVTAGRSSPISTLYVSCQGFCLRQTQVANVYIYHDEAAVRSVDFDWSQCSTPRCVLRSHLLRPCQSRPQCAVKFGPCSYCYYSPVTVMVDSRTLERMNE